MEDASQPCTCSADTEPVYQVASEECTTPRPTQTPVPNAPLKPSVWTPTLGATPAPRVALFEYYPSTIIQPPFPIKNYDPDATEPPSLKLVRTLSHNYEAQRDAYKYMPLCGEGDTIFTNYWMGEGSLDFTYLKRKGDVFYQIEVHTTMYGDYKKDYTFSCCQEFIKGQAVDPFDTTEAPTQPEATSAAAAL